MTKNQRKSKSKPKATRSKQIIKPQSSQPPSEAPLPKRRRSRKSLKEEQQPILDESGESPYQLTHSGGVFTAKLHQTYTVTESHQLYKSIQALFALFLAKQRKRNKKVHTHIPISYFPTFEFLLQEEKPSENKCSICQFQYQDLEDYEEQLVRESDDDIVSLSCSHLLHKSCFYGLKGAKDWIRCPVCSTIFGQMIGDQPSGSMTWVVNSLMHCDGFEDVGTIVIDYSMQGGKRGAVSFQGTHRTAYLPDNQRGNEVLQLLRTAFDRKLVFTVGRSVTTGRDNQVVWNGIHHKTNTSGGSSHFGYPDLTYFDRVKLQMAAKGVV